MMNKIHRKLIEFKLRKAPKQEREMILFLYERDPELFAEIAKKIKEGTDRGQPEELAAAAVIKDYQGKIQKYFIEYQTKFKK